MLRAAEAMAAYAAADVCPAYLRNQRGPETDASALRGMPLPRTGVALVAHLLQQRSPRHLSIELLHAMEALLRAVGPCEALHTAVLQRLLLNLRLWAAAPLPIQRSFQALLLKLAKVGRSPLKLRRNPSASLFVMRLDWWQTRALAGTSCPLSG